MSNLSSMLTGNTNTGMMGGREQIIGGKSYAQYSPQWYEAMRQNNVDKSVAAGTALGAGTKAAYDAMGNPADTSKSSSSGSSSGSSSEIPRVGGGPVGSGPTPWPYGGGGGGTGGGNSQIPQISTPDLTAAENAVYGRAKDKIGQTSQGALAGLRSSLAGRGLLGSGGEYRGTAAIAQGGQQQIGEAVRDQAIHGLDLNADIAKANLGASVTGRGQDISRDVATRGQDIDYSLGYRSGDITQRGQDISRLNNKDALAANRSLQEAAQRQQIITGLMNAMNTAGLY